MLLAVAPAGTESVTPLLLMVVVRTTGWRCVPNLCVTIPFSTGQGKRPLLETKLAARALASGVNTKPTVFVPAFLFDAAIASRIRRAISLSITSRCFCLFLICAV